MKLAEWKVLAISASSSVLLAVNFFAKSPIIGVVALVLLIGGTSFMLGSLLFAKEEAFFRFFFGATTLITLLSLIGSILTLLGTFTEPVTLIALVAIIVWTGTFLVPLRKGEIEQHEVSSPAPKDSEPSKWLGIGESLARTLYTLPFWIWVAVAVRLLLFGRTGEGETSVWLTIPNLFIASYFLAALALVILMLFTDLGYHAKLILVCVFSFLSHSLFLLVWYPGRYGDPWSHLGQIRFLLKSGEPYAYSWMLQSHLYVDLIKFRAMQSLVGFIQRILAVDLYWVYMWFVPVLWSIFVPVLAFRIGGVLTVKKSKLFPILASLVTVVFTTLIAWGAVSVPNSLGFIFFFICAGLFLLWMKQGMSQYWVVSLLAAVASLLTHPQTGIVAFMFLFFGTLVQKTSRKVLWALSFPLMLGIYPFALLLHGASLELSGMFAIVNFLAFQSEMSTILLVFALVGLVLGVRRSFLGSKPSLLLFAFCGVLFFEYYFTKYGMSNLPYGPARILAMADFLLVPFVAAGFWMLAVSLKKAVAGVQSSFRVGFLSRLGSEITPRALGILLIGLFLSLQATAVLYQAYPLTELVKVQPSYYEVEAIQFIDSNSPERYVVLCEPGFSSLAVGFLGTDYGYLGGSRGVFGVPEWSYPTIQMYAEMTKNPSIGILQEAMKFAEAEISYFVISVRNPDFETIVNRALEIFPAHHVFGSDQLYVFWYPLPVIEKPGDSVRVTFDDGLGGQQNIPTTLTYMIESETNATLTLSGHSSYNVTEFPIHWTFLTLIINNAPRSFDESSDVNTFVYVRDLQTSDVVNVKWLFNQAFSNVGWKEDSFKLLDKWHRHELYPGTMVPTVRTDGNILGLSYLFTPDSYWYYYYTTSVNVATNDYPYLLMRWRSSMPVAVASVYFELGASYPIIPIGSSSPEWSTIIVQLPPDVIVRTFMVGLSNVRNQRLAGLGTIEVDYILLASKISL